jgi:hypothetical protein
LGRASKRLILSFLGENEERKGKERNESRTERKKGRKMTTRKKLACITV